jgi:hypothetical protein
MKLKKVFLGVTLAMASAAACADGPFSSINFFGGSLTDSGAFGGLGGLPAAKLAYHDVWRNWPTSAVVGQAYYNSSFTMPLTKPREDYAEVGTSISGNIAKNWNLSANATFSFAKQMNATRWFH